MKNVLIVGGAGYIGSHAVKRFMAEGINPVVFDNLIAGHRDAVLCKDFFLGDLNNKEDISAVFEKFDIDAVMHFAAHCYVGESVENPEKYYFNNVVGGLNLLSAMMKADVKNLIFSSTCAIYGNPVEIPITEAHPKAPINPYGTTKYLFEKAMEDYSVAYGLRYVSLRYFNAAGADPTGELGERHDPETHLIPVVLMAASGEKDGVTIFGDDYDTPDGTCVRDYIHISDLISAHLLAYARLEGGGESEAFNLGSESGYSVKEVIDVCREVTGLDVKVTIGKRRPGDPPVLVAKSEKIQSEMGFRLEYPELVDIVQTAWNFMQKRKMVK